MGAALRLAWPLLGVDGAAFAVRAAALAGAILAGIVALCRPAPAGQPGRPEERRRASHAGRRPRRAP
ncbi:MAG: hypothetical protein MZV64_49525 [Ignavibacteriales bacterium]|nr:hypothetical protein [Ignavibacteriales bacterium]